MVSIVNDGYVAWGLISAGADIMRAGDGLKPSSRGQACCLSTADARTVIDGPFAATRELVAGFWIWEVRDMDEAVALGEALPQSDARTERDRNPTAIRV